jgi:glycine/D-amino acid oxidase-like deaminating enzyme
VIIGAGISGALIAEALTDAGITCRNPGQARRAEGSTTATTALVQYELDAPLIKLSEMVGRDKAERIWRRSRLAVDALRERSRILGIKADVTNRDSLYLSGNVLSHAALQREGDARRRAGFNATFFDKREVYERFGVKGRRRSSQL